jgi:hypothetical protein
VRKRSAEHNLVMLFAVVVIILVLADSMTGLWHQ